MTSTSVCVCVRVHVRVHLHSESHNVIWHHQNTQGSSQVYHLVFKAKEKSKSKDIGKWQDDKITYQIGRYGPYVKWKKIMASVKQKDTSPSLEEAISLIQDKMHQK